MAKVIKRKWLSRGPTGRKVKRIAWGYTITGVFIKLLRA
jgi:hypothetical protein